MKKIFQYFFMIIGVVTLTGCASLQSSKSPGADISVCKTFYVQKQPKDARGIDKIISDRLNVMGFQSTCGIDETPPKQVDAIVTYVDKWMWDMTMYMLQLNIQMRDGKTRMIMANGQSYRPSLQRRSPERMVKEVLDEMLKK